MEGTLYTDAGAGDRDAAVGETQRDQEKQR